MSVSFYPNPPTMEKNGMMETNFMQVPLAPPLPPLYQANHLAPKSMFMPGPPSAAPVYPTIENQHHLLNSVQFHNGKQENNGLTREPETRPATVFILNGKQPIGPEPQKTHCPHCKEEQISRVESRISLVAHLVAVCCCLIGCFCLSPLPYCLGAFKSKLHYCSTCGQYIGRFTQK